MTRVLMLVHNMAGMTAYLRAHSLARWLVKMGYDMTVIPGRRISGLHVSEEQLDGVRVIQMPDVFPERIRHGGLSPVDLLGRILHVSRTPYDIIHGFEPRPCTTVPAFLARWLRHAPFVADWCDLWGMEGIAGLRGPLARATLGRFDHMWERYTRLRADMVIANNSELVRRGQVMGLPPDRIQLVWVGANSDIITPLPQEAMRAKYGLPTDAQIIVHTGFTVYDARLLAETFVALARRNQRAMMLMAGGVLPHVDEIVAEAGFADRMRHVGFVPYETQAEILACGDVMVVPYTNRLINVARFPIRFGDYLAAGRPIVTNATGDMGEIVKGEDVGLLAPEDPDAFANVIQTLMDNAPLREEMGRRARQLAETRFSWRMMAERVDGVYQMLLRGSSGGFARRSTPELECKVIAGDVAGEIDQRNALGQAE